MMRYCCTIILIPKLLKNISTAGLIADVAVLICAAELLADFAVGIKNF